ncbi:MAG TPA: cyclic nucleotide-binding domain-containing protein [Bryobacteraceae bacterium]|nr:cyclic nucleotide-binding domain-containing protein [Bryobacteraceae bacterium]
MVPDEMIEFARIYRVLSELDPEQLKKVLPLAQESHYRRGELLFREGDRSTHLHLIVSGDVSLELMAGDHSISVQTAHPGEAIGWSALTPGSRTHFQARALAPVQTVSFAGDRLREACDRDPAMGYALTKQLLALVTDRLDAARLQLVDAYLTRTSESPLQPSR